MVVNKDTALMKDKLAHDEYFCSLKVLSELIKKEIWIPVTLRFKNDSLYSEYVKYCAEFENCSPISKRVFTTCLTRMLADNGDMVFQGKIPGKGIFFNLPIGGLPRRSST